MRLDQKVVLVTGAGGQLGKQFCQALAREGASVWVSDLDREQCEVLVSHLPQTAPHYPLVMDVGDPKSVKNTFAEIKRISGVLDMIINNEGIAVFTTFENRSFDDFMNVFKVNAGGTFLCIQKGSKLMRGKNER